MSAARGYAPLGGVFLVSLVMALIAACCPCRDRRAGRARHAGRSLAPLAAIAALALPAASRSSQIEWTSPAGAPLAVSLVQGNVLQDVKFDPQFRAATFERYLQLVEQSRGRLVVLPESAFPMFSDEVPDAVLLSLIRTASARDGDVLLGLFTAEAPEPGSDEPRYYNTVVALGGSELQFYRKNHLVPFGETIPLKPLIGWFIHSVLAIPLADQARGGATQPPLVVADTARGREHLLRGRVRRRADPRRARRAACSSTSPTMRGTAVRSRPSSTTRSQRCARSSSAARCCARRTPASPRRSAHDGRELARLPWFTTGILEVRITGRDGTTPYVRFGDGLMLALAAAAFAVPVLLASLYRARGRTTGAPRLTG